MFSLFKCAVAILLYIITFYIYGFTFLESVRIKQQLCESVVCGLLVYFTIFQFYFVFFSIVVPLPFNIFSIIWFVINLVMTLLGIRKCHFLILEDIRKMIKEVKLFVLKHPVIAILLIVIMGISYVRIVLRPVVEIDPSNYLRIMNTTLYRNRIFLSGDAIPVKEIMRAFYYQFTTISSVLRIKPILVCFYVSRSIGFIGTNMVSYLIGKVIYKKNITDNVCFIMIFQILCYLWFSVYCTNFYTRRLYEAKGYCQYIICPFMFYFWIKLNSSKKYSDLSQWSLMFLCAIASIPVSASSLLLTPVGIICGGLLSLAYGWDIQSIDDKETIIKYSTISVIPNAIYLLIYLMSITGYLSIFPNVIV